jgi:hypothetical protein
MLEVLLVHLQTEAVAQQIGALAQTRAARRPRVLLLLQPGPDLVQELLVVHLAEAEGEAVLLETLALCSDDLGGVLLLLIMLQHLDLFRQLLAIFPELRRAVVVSPDLGPNELVVRLFYGFHCFGIVPFVLFRPLVALVSSPVVEGVDVVQGGFQFIQFLSVFTKNLYLLDLFYLVHCKLHSKIYIKF